MSYRFDRLRIALVILTLAASAAVGFAQSRARTVSPEREARPTSAQAAAAGGAAAAAPKPRYPGDDDPRMVADPAETFLGPPGATNPFLVTAMNENPCRAMANCQVVQGQTRRTRYGAAAAKASR